MAQHIQYSEKYFDDEFEYRHVVLPAEVAARLPKGQLLLEHEWRELGVQQSRGWLHYSMHRPEPHIMLFRRAHTVETLEQVKALEAERLHQVALQLAQHQAYLQQQRLQRAAGAGNGPLS